MVNYSTQVNQMPAAYYPVSPSGSRKQKIGTTLAGGLIGMTAYYIPVKKDTFVQKAFDITKEEANNQIETLKTIAEEVEANKVTTKSKMILQDMGLSEDVTAITNKCSELDQKVSDPAAVKALKKEFSRNFESYKKDCALMDNNCAQAFKAARWNKFRWGMGIGAAIGLTLGLISSRD